MGQHEFLGRLALAALLGGLVGFDRHRADKAAGMRTHMLVSLGSALFMVVSAYGFDPVLRPSRVVLDPSRVAAQIVTGIGFLGGGMILRRGESVVGLTTAASVWAVAAVGMATGGGLYVTAVGATAMVLVILALIKPLEDRFPTRDGPRRLSLVVVDGGQQGDALAEIEDACRRAALEIKGVKVGPGDRPDERRVSIDVGRPAGDKLLALVNRLQALPGVREVAFEDHPS